MKNIKQRSPAQITGDRAVHILHTLLPEEWVVMELNPDYGLDLLIQFFEGGSKTGEFIYPDEYTTEVYAASGEFIFVQVKGTRYLSLDRQKKNVCFRIDTALLGTVKRMPDDVPILLIVVDIEARDAYFLCLNDYVDKQLCLKQPDWRRQKTITIKIPITNHLSGCETGRILLWYGKRRRITETMKKLMVSAEKEDMIRELDHQLEEIHHISLVAHQSGKGRYSEFPEILKELFNRMVLIKYLLMESETSKIDSLEYYEKISDCLAFYEESCRKMLLYEADDE